MEARLVTPNGFSVSIATEWIENPEGVEYDKQDCERKGFARLAATLQEVCPRLPMLILADGLYPYHVPEPGKGGRQRQEGRVVLTATGSIQTTSGTSAVFVLCCPWRILIPDFCGVLNSAIKQRFFWEGGYVARCSMGFFRN
ncbi:MAG: hypothetical protein NTX45_20475 [Proteobacteria bacterium]|nr:hypothetical protein [Pseudomonadota bacterium]